MDQFCWFRIIAPDHSKSAKLVHDALLKLIKNFPVPDPGFVHGDFYPGQVIIKDNRAGIIDFDRSYTGDPIADIGNFIANIRLLKLKGNPIDDAVIEKMFLTAYEESSGKKLDEKRIRFWTIFGIYQLAVNPFRGLEPGWRPKTARILRECLSLLPWKFNPAIKTSKRPSMLKKCAIGSSANYENSGTITS